ncbi:hypothetical protein EDC01DRAFT_313842 [Geopyxis carbonaria]|nr:hypothetical protein EDC01DRAFT_313842 [Geopyxis carbonaria]
MADPLSVAASIVGLLAASAKIASTLYSVSSSAGSASQLLERVRSEILILSGIFGQLQTLVLSANVGDGGQLSGRSNIEVGELVVTLTACVVTFSELEGLVGVFGEDGNDGKGLNMWDRVRWMAREGDVRRIMDDLVSMKVSLNLMLATIQGKSTQETTRNLHELRGNVDELMASNRLISRQLRTLMARQSPDAASIRSTNTVRSSLDTILQRTRVYERTLKPQKPSVVLPSGGRNQARHPKAAPSVRNERNDTRSLADVPNLSLLSLPVFPALDLHVPSHYPVSDTTTTPLPDPTAPPSDPPVCEYYMPSDGKGLLYEGSLKEHVKSLIGHPVRRDVAAGAGYGPPPPFVPPGPRQYRKFKQKQREVAEVAAKSPLRSSSVWG